MMNPPHNNQVYPPYKTTAIHNMPNALILGFWKAHEEFAPKVPDILLPPKNTNQT